MTEPGFACLVDLRARPSSENVQLWHAGFLTDRTAVTRDLDLNSDAPDAVVVAAACGRWGSSAAARLSGPIAWIAPLERDGLLVAATDRLGCRPLFYAREGSRLWLADRIESLLHVWPGRRQPNPLAVAHHLAGTAPPPGETCYDGIRRLPGGSQLVASTTRFDVCTYWQLEAPPVLRLSSDDEYAEALHALLVRIVGESVPSGQVGITLSSGMDSTSVAASIRLTHPSSSLRAFVWSAPELPDADETPWAVEVANRLGIPVEVVRADQRWPLRQPEGLRSDIDGPNATFFGALWDETCRLARTCGITTLVDGQGGDELFGGDAYPYADFLIQGRWGELVRQFRRHCRRSPLRPALLTAVRLMIASPLRDAYLPRRVSRLVCGEPWAGPEIRRLESERPPRRSSDRRVLPGRRRRLEMLRSPWIAHVRGERVRSAGRCGIDLRSPLLDHRLFEFAASLPADQTMRDGQRKVILRRAMRSELPRSIVDRWGKILPTRISERGLREREQEQIRGYLSDMRAHDLGYVDADALRRAYEDYVAGRSRSVGFWYALTLEDWLRRYC